MELPIFFTVPGNGRKRVPARAFRRVVLDGAPGILGVVSFEEVRAEEAGFEPPSDSSEPRTGKALRHCDWSTSRRAGPGRRDALIQFLIDDLDRAVDFCIGYAKLMRNQLHQQVDAFDGRCATSDRPGR